MALLHSLLSRLYIYLLHTVLGCMKLKLSEKKSLARFALLLTPTALQSIRVQPALPCLCVGLWSGDHCPRLHLARVGSRI